jgi:hypothetical protein
VNCFQSGLHPILRFIFLFPRFSKLIEDVIGEQKTKELETGDEGGEDFCFL